MHSGKRALTDRGNAMNCEDCAYYIYDDEYEEYSCSADIDQDDYARIMDSARPYCPFYRNGDEYAVVRHQM